MSEKKTSNIDSGDTISAEIGDVENSAIAVGYKNIVGSKMDGDLVARDKIINIQQAASAPLNALHQVPPPPADFTGRKDELQGLLAAIAQREVTISGLQGLGGIGKTALALKLVEQLKPSYPDAQFYLDLKASAVNHSPSARYWPMSFALTILPPNSLKVRLSCAPSTSLYSMVSVRFF